jgi:hypothetical protein
LVEQDAAALRRVELLRPARPVQIIGVVEAEDHAELAEVAAHDHVAHQPHRGIESMGVADHELDLMPLSRRDDGVAIGQRQRHRLFQDDVLAMLGGEDGVRRVELVRRGDIDHLNRGIGAELFHIGIGLRVVIAGEGLARLRMRIGGGFQHEPGMSRGGMHHHRAGHAEADDAEPDGL